MIENEFGEVDVDSELVSIKEDLPPGEEDEEQIMMLNNGCLCCTVRDDLVEMLGKLVCPLKRHLIAPQCLVLAASHI